MKKLIVDYTKGKGKYEKMLGGFVCSPLKNMDTYHLIDKDENNEFTISGMDDEVRSNYKEHILLEQLLLMNVQEELNLGNQGSQDI